MRSAIIAATVLVVSVGLAQAGIRADLSGDVVVDFATTMDMPFMTVGNAGNVGEATGALDSSTGIYAIVGAVDYTYNIGKFEVTAGQYTEFLNAVAADDTYKLYSTMMWSSDYGCKIGRTGSAGSYTYAVASDREDRPVNYVSWADAARFANWLTNGMPSGTQDLTTTENGAYYLNGATINAALLAVDVPSATRRAELLDGEKPYFMLPTEDEWYKASYHKNDGVTGNYWDYPTGSDGVPSNVVIDPDGGNNSNYRVGDENWSIGGPYYCTEVGEFEYSESPYGTFDQGGNVIEWNDTIIASDRARRGGAYWYSDYQLEATWRGGASSPLDEDHEVGFRLAAVPEPATLGLLALGGLALLRRKSKIPSGRGYAG